MQRPIQMLDFIFIEDQSRRIGHQHDPTCIPNHRNSVWTRLVGSRVSPAALLLRANGVERVLLAAGEFDGARPDMTLAARVLDRAGMPARFVSLGRAGHSFAPSEAWLREALGWLGRRGD